MHLLASIVAYKNLIESELFGHEKGLLEQQQRKGRFELANGGTIFLDEIGDISPAIQVRLLEYYKKKHLNALEEMKLLL